METSFTSTSPTHLRFTCKTSGSGRLSTSLQLTRPFSLATDIALVADSTQSPPSLRTWKSHDVLLEPATHQDRGVATRWRYEERPHPSAPPAGGMLALEGANPSRAPSARKISRFVCAARPCDKRMDSSHPSPTAGEWTLCPEPSYARSRISMADDGQQLLGAKLNDMYLPECRDVAQVYRIEPRQVSGGRPAHDIGFDPDMLLRSNGKQGRYLFTMESREEAIGYGQQQYGEGNFEMFRLDTRGMPAVRYRSHAELSLLFDDARPFDAEGGRAFQRGDVYLEVSELEAGRVHRERVKGMPGCCTIA